MRRKARQGILQRIAIANEARRQQRILGKASAAQESPDPIRVRTFSFLTVEHPKVLICQECCKEVGDPLSHMSDIHDMKVSDESLVRLSDSMADGVVSGPINALPLVPIEDGMMCSGCGRCALLRSRFTCCGAELVLVPVQRVHQNYVSVVDRVPATLGVDELVITGEVKRAKGWRQKCLETQESLADALATISDLKEQRAQYDDSSFWKAECVRLVAALDNLTAVKQQNDAMKKRIAAVTTKHKEMCKMLKTFNTNVVNLFK